LKPAHGSLVALSPTSPGTPIPPRRLLSGLAKSVRTPITLGVAYGVLNMLARSFVPIVTGVAIDRGILRRDRHELLVWGAVMFGLVVFQAATTTLQERSDFATNVGTPYRVMQLVGMHSAELGATLHKRISTGEAVNLGIGDITPIGQALAATSRGLGGVAAIIGVAVITLISAWQLALMVLIGVPTLAWLLTGILTPVRRKQRMVRKQQGELAQLAVDIAGGLRALRGIGGEKHFVQLFRDKSEAVRHMAVEAAGLQARAAAVRTILNGLFSMAIVWLGAHLVLSGKLQVGQLVAFYGYAVFLAALLDDRLDRIPGPGTGFRGT
jgi:ABC-type bacteriocin/lantibiotic exporter with double-glycine peptidase domain